MAERISANTLGDTPQHCFRGGSLKESLLVRNRSEDNVIEKVIDNLSELVVRNQSAHRTRELTSRFLTPLPP